MAHRIGVSGLGSGIRISPASSRPFSPTPSTQALRRPQTRLPGCRPRECRPSRRTQFSEGRAPDWRDRRWWPWSNMQLSRHFRVIRSPRWRGAAWRIAIDPARACARSCDSQSARTSRSERGRRRAGRDNEFNFAAVHQHAIASSVGVIILDMRFFQDDGSVRDHRLRLHRRADGLCRPLSLGTLPPCPPEL